MWIAVALAAAVSGLPPGARLVELPREPVQPYMRQIEANGSCAIMHTDLGFIALTADLGKTFRFVPAVPKLADNAQLYCHGNEFFLATYNAVRRLRDDVWQSVGSSPTNLGARYRGLLALRGRLYLGTGASILVSRDGGATFAPALPGVRTLASDGTRLVAGKDKEIHEVDANDQLSPLGKLDKPVEALGFVAGAWYASTASSVFRSEDGAKSWKRDTGAPAAVEGLVALGTTLIAHVPGGSRARSEKGQWSTVRDVYRVHPSATGAWLHIAGGPIAHVSKLGEPHTAFTFPFNPQQTIRAVAASRQSLIVAGFRPNTVYASSDGGRTFRSTCKGVNPDAAVLDADRLQLTRFLTGELKGCRVAGFKTRIVPQLPDETCNGDLCVRFRSSRLLRTRDRGKTWQELTSALRPSEHALAAAAAAGRELIVARGRTWSMEMSSIQSYNEVLRSIDDGKTWKPLVMPGPITAFAPGDDGWYVGTMAHGLVLVPYEK